MKKAVSILLTAILILSVAVTPAFAQSSKMSETLIAELSKREDDNILGVVAELNYEVSAEADSELHAKTALECGYTLADAATQAQQNAYLTVYNNYLAEYHKAKNVEIAKDLGVDTEVEWGYSSANKIYLEITKAKAEEIALSDMIKSLDYWGSWIIPDPDNLFENLFLKKYSGAIFADSHKYEELYYHYDENGEMDWALIYECSYNCPPWNYHIVFKDRILMYGTNTPFSFGYGIYDVKTGEFHDIITDTHQRYEFDFEDYDGLEEVFDSLQIGYPIGDADLDHDLSIMDATYIQSVLAQMGDFDSKDLVEYYHGYVDWSELGYPKYISDINRDGERNILDATAVQLKLARLNET